MAEFERKRLVLEDRFELGGEVFSAREVIEKFGSLLTPERIETMGRVAGERRLSFYVVMENIYDRGNISAVMRTAEGFGFIRFVLIEKPGASFKAANRVTRGADKWLDTVVVPSTREAVFNLKAQGVRVLASSLAGKKTLKEFDLTEPTAIVIGNEKEGISEEMAGLAEDLFVLPMKGFSQSFNLSVASALCFAEVDRQGADCEQLRPSTLEREILLANYILRSIDEPERLVHRLKD